MNLSNHDDDNDDRDLARAFAALREEQSINARSFGHGSRGTWHPRVGVVGAMAVATAVALLAGSFLLIPHRAPSPSVGQIAFAELNDIIERETFVASATGWEAPTDFLLNPEFSSIITTDHEH